jgi:paraquat-inducible protein B
VVEFEQSVRGLVPGAPVEYRGIPVGSVRRVMLRELGASSAGKSGAPIPVLIALEPGRMMLPDTAEMADAFLADIEQDVANGARVTLRSGNLLTGSLLVSLDFYPEEAPAKVGSYAGYPTLPTLPGGFERIERQISQLLAKLNDLELETTVRELNATLAAVRTSVGSDSMRQLPATLDDSLRKLDRTLESVEALSRTVEEQPNSLIFSKTVQPDPEPRANHD